MNMREQFESWAEKELLPLDRRDNDHYRYNLTNRAWAGWQAALASQAKRIAELESATEYQDTCTDGGKCGAGGYCKDCIQEPTKDE